MFCPRCKAEYRAGFTHCSDCDVDLVQDPPQFALAGRSPAEPGDPNEDPFCSFWKGQDARVHAELCEVLEQAGIPHKTVFRSDHLFNLSNFPAYEIGVPFSMFENAEKVIVETYGTGDGEDAGTQKRSATVPILPESLAVSAADLPGPPAAGTEGDWYPGDAAENVWVGEAGDPSDFLVAALHENGISCRRDEQGAQAKLYVLPHNAARAREIIREIAENQSMEEE
jgi:hypothetical protein